MGEGVLVGVGVGIEVGVSVTVAGRVGARSGAEVAVGGSVGLDAGVLHPLKSNRTTIEVITMFVEIPHFSTGFSGCLLSVIVIPAKKHARFLLKALAIRPVAAHIQVISNETISQYYFLISYSESQ